MAWKWISKGLTAIQVWGGTGTLVSPPCLPSCASVYPCGSWGDSWFSHVSSLLGKAVVLGSCYSWMR